MTRDEFIQMMDAVYRDSVEKELLAHDAEQRRAIERLEQKNAAIREALQLLYDCQNGCPLPKYQADWGRAMELTQRILFKEPTL